MSEVNEVVEAVRDAMVKNLSQLVLQGLEEARKVLKHQSNTFSDSEKLAEARSAVVDRFSSNVGINFNVLMGETDKTANALDYGSLSLVEEDDLEAIIAMEGMISHSRNCDVQQYLAFTTHIDTLFYGTRIDESNNPMDPEQISTAFKDALRPLGLSSTAVLTVYRHFNSHVFHKLELVLEKANATLIEYEILPDLDIAARDKSQLENKRRVPRPNSDPQERAFGPVEDQTDDQPEPSTREMFSMMQNLMHGMAGQAATVQQASQSVATGQGVQAPGMLPPGLQPGMMVGNQKVELVPNDQLLNLLGELQTGRAGINTDGDEPGVKPAVNLGDSIGSLLQQRGDDKTLQVLDSQTSDVISLVTMLFDVIWNDETVPIAVKGLIGRTQVTVLKIALDDAGFFDAEEHPARDLLNELATAGLSWTEFDKLEGDPMYSKMHEIVGKLTAEYKGDLALVSGLLHEFRLFKRNQMLANKEMEQRLDDADERQNRLDEVSRYAQAKISERILDDGIHPFVRSFLGSQFKKFVVQVILREGPGGISWKPVMNTIDVLLWTVQPEKQESDFERFAKINPRLLVNLGKALEVAGIDTAEADDALNELEKIQEQCFKGSSTPDNEVTSEATDETGQVNDSEPVEVVEDLPEDNEYVIEVSKYPIGIWLEFHTDSEHMIRCTLAAKIDTIDKYVFVNSQGVKVIEKSRMGLGLARELMAGTVKVISEGPLVERAMETVIGNLREGDS
ncbi:MAG TPA: hypothetical protein DCM64_08410 [Gammaproteobacteria bacterium]|nr:hypothetical protein [Gammaproteobacteria bacterium]